MSNSGQQVIRWVILCLTIISVALGGVMVGHCTFVKGEMDAYTFLYNIWCEGVYQGCVTAYSDYLDGYDIDKVDVYAGLFSAKYDIPSGPSSSCEEYPSNFDFDAPLKSAKAFGIMTLVFSALAMLLVLLNLLFLDIGKRAVWVTVRIMYLACFVFQGVTFVLFASDWCDEIDCTLSIAGIIAVVNCFLLLVLCVLSFLVAPSSGKPVMSCGCEDSDEAVVGVEKEQAPYMEKQTPVESGVETIKINIVDGPHGEKITTKEVTHPDGTRTITETVEEI